MSALTASEWIDRVRAASAGAELLGFLRGRLTRPYDEGPTLDDRQGEGAEEVFERLAKESETFRMRLDETIAGYFRDRAADPADPETHTTTRGLLELVQGLALAGTFSPIRAWLEQHEAVLRSDERAGLGHAALGALATSQISGIADTRDFWLCWWQKGPAAWQPRAFMGLRLQDPRAAAREIPELVTRAEAQPPGAGPLLLGMWKQPEGRTALLTWLKEAADDATADKVRRALRPLLRTAEEQDALGKPRLRRRLQSLATSEQHSWAQ
jgi:hypothetical protein